jgi:hypothetical protein
VLLGISVATLSSAVVPRAAGYADRELGSLDAIHLAMAEHLSRVTPETLGAFVACDE